MLLSPIHVMWPWMFLTKLLVLMGGVFFLTGVGSVGFCAYCAYDMTQCDQSTMNHVMLVAWVFIALGGLSTCLGLVCLGIYTRCEINRHQIDEKTMLL